MDLSFWAFVLYLLMMVIIGALYAKKNSTTEDYFLGGRSLGGFVAALSAQASDMSGWLLMGLPGSIYALGTGQAWICYRTFYRNCTELDLYFRKTPQVYDQGEQFTDPSDLL